MKATERIGSLKRSSNILQSHTPRVLGLGTITKSSGYSWSLSRAHAGLLCHLLFLKLNPCYEFSYRSSLRVYCPLVYPLVISHSPSPPLLDKLRLFLENVSLYELCRRGKFIQQKNLVKLPKFYCVLMTKLVTVKFNS